MLRIAADSAQQAGHEAMEKLYRYDLIGASLSGESRHPQQVIRELGLKIVYGEPVPIADCWLFRFKEPFSVELPHFIEYVKETDETARRYSTGKTDIFVPNSKE